MSQFWSSHVHSLTPYTPGEQPQINNLIKLNTNENPYGPSPRVIAAINAENSADLRKYPDPSASKLKQTIAAYHGLQQNNVFVGNSSDEVLAHIFRALLDQKHPLLFPDITYSFYSVYCKLFGIEYEQVPLRDDFTLALEDYAKPNGGIIFANPNAPTGLALTSAQIEKLLQSNKHAVVVIDEAYVDFANTLSNSECAVSAVGLITKYPNLVVTQTLSKSRSLAGLRVGFALASTELIDGMERVKNSFHPYALDSLALAGAEASFEDTAYFESCRDKIITTRIEITQQLQGLGFSVVPSSANFVFVRHARVAAQILFNGLREQGIVVRYFDKPRLNEYLRISIGSDAEMARLMQVVSELIS